MGKRYQALETAHIDFIRRQHIFFVATAAWEGTVNLSPKGLDSLRVLNKNRIIWLNVTGSGNETSAHVQQNPRMTIMFCAVEDKPLILRAYGQARVIHPKDSDWSLLYPRFNPLPGARQIFDLDIELVQTSCGMGVPLFDFVGQREELIEWGEHKGEDGIKEYWRDKNQASLDGLPTNIVKKGL